MTGPVRVVLSGKGGVGKSTLAALVARTLARAGRRVLAVDGDEQCNLGPALGVDPAALAHAGTLAGASDYVFERAGGPGLVRLNPDARDAVERLGVGAPDGVRLLTLGAAVRAGGGCLCPETAMLAAAVGDLALRDEDVVVLDTHAGVEHFGRALARGFDRAIAVATPSATALEAAARTVELARELGIPRVAVAINQCRSDEDAARAWGHLGRLGVEPDLAVSLPFDDALLALDPSVERLLGASALARSIPPLLAWLDEPATIAAR